MKTGTIYQCWELYKATAAPDELNKVRTLLGIRKKEELPTTFKGLKLLKLVHYLKEAGWEMTEFRKEPQELNPLLFSVIEILAKEIIAPIPAATEVGYNQPSDMNRALLKAYKPTPRNIERLKIFAQKYGKNQTSIKPDFTATLSVTNELKKLAEKAEPIIEKFLKNSDRTTREEFRNILEKELSIFKISNLVFRIDLLIGALCSEEARSNYFDNQKKKRR